MGLIDKVDKDKKHSSVKALRKNIGRRIQQQEYSKVKSPKVAQKGGKIHVSRPEGALKLMQEQERKDIDPKQSGKTSDKTVNKQMKKIKDAINAKSQSPKSTTGNSRIATGIQGLDPVMSGGFRGKTVNLIAGGAGSGKSILAMQFLVSGIDDYGEPGVFISFEETEEEIVEDMACFGWNLKDKIKDKLLTIVTYTPEQIEKVLHSGGGTIRDIVESIKAKRLVFDSLTAFTLLHDSQLLQRKAVISLFEAIKKWNCTALLLAEQEATPETHQSSVEEFEVDGVILLYNIRRGNIRERALEVFKMRATKHSAKIFPMTISDNGIKIYPDEDVF
jgi:circadian clock protein KaiC